MLCTDITDFTPASEFENAGPVEQTLVTYDEVLFSEAFRHNGFFRYNVGDTYFITFRSVRDAFDAARSMRALLVQHRDRGDTLPVGFQFGLALGAVREFRGRLYGVALSREAPVLGQTIARGDQIVVSRDFWNELTAQSPSATAVAQVRAEGKLAVRGKVGELEYLVL